MHERLPQLLRRPALPRRPLLIVVGATVGFLIVVATQLHPADPEGRLPDGLRLAALIQRQQREIEAQRLDVEALRNEVSDTRERTLIQGADTQEQRVKLDQARLSASTIALEGEGFVVTLDDSSLSSAPTGNVNDLVIHSHDVQAVVNGLWASGAEAISINNQRVIATSAVLCVGNTLLINGTVHAPPYEVTAIGADRSLFTSDPLVRRLRQDAERFSLRFSIGSERVVEVPGYSGLITPKYAHVASG